MKRFLLLNILIINVLFITAQIKVSGQIVDCETKEPLRYACLGFHDTKIPVFVGESLHYYETPIICTDKNGNFEFEYQDLKNDSVKISYYRYSGENKIMKQFVLPDFLIEVVVSTGGYYYPSDFLLTFYNNAIFVDGVSYTIENGITNIEFCLKKNKEPVEISIDLIRHK